MTDRNLVMKKEYKKKNAIESQRVSVENLPKTKRWWQEYIPLLIAVLALGVSIYSAYLSRKEFIAAYRPYIYVSNRRTEEDGKKIMDINTVVLKCLNAPARIVNQEAFYILIKTKENDKEEVTKSIPLNFTITSNILYPSESTTSQITFTYDFKKEILAKDSNAKLRRKVRIDYKELSTDRKYYFEGYWDYNRTYNVWETNNIFAD